MTLEHAIDGGARDLKVTATAFPIDDERLTVCTIEDISQQKRLNVLSRIFFHDVLNTAGGIQGYVNLLGEGAQEGDEWGHELRHLSGLTDHLIEEIESQRDLTHAENGDLEVDPRPVHTTELLADLVMLYSGHPVAEGRSIEMAEIWDGRLITDVRLLARVLGNMVKNALEATDPGGKVTLNCECDGSRVAFHVHNASVMPEETQMQIFHRSFSTKASTGRGIGTYSMKLLGERYLGGRVSFTSHDARGTVFSISVPRVYSTLNQS
jgi:signal transduction histidine kinase